MSAPNIIVACLWCLLLGLWYVLGYRLGLRKGKALGWQEHYFECVERDRARRHRNGQWKAKEGTRP